MSIAQGAVAVKTGLWTAAQWALNIALTANPIGIIIVSVGALIGAVVYLVTHWEIVKTKIIDGWNYLKDAFNNAPGWVKGIIALILLPIMPFIALPVLIIKNWETIKNFFVNLWTVVKEQFRGPVGLITTMLSPFISLPILIISNWDRIKSFFAELLPSIGSGLDKYVVSPVKGLLDSVGKLFFGSGKKAAETFGDGIRAGAPSATQSTNFMMMNIRPYFPQSDAKVGPLSALTKSGRALVSTFGTGIEEESRRNTSTHRFVDLQAKTIKESSPVIQKITNASRKIEAKSMVGNLQISLDGKKLSVSEFASMFTEMLETQIDSAGA